MQVKARPIQRGRRIGRIGLAVAFVSIVASASVFNWLWEMGALHAKSPQWAVEAVLMNWGFRTGREVRELGLKTTATTVLAAPLTAARAFSSEVDEPPTLYIDIKFKHLKVLRDSRADALDHRFIFKRHKGWVPITLSTADKTVKAKMRLKGEQIDHLQHAQKWGVRIHIKKGGHVLGMRRFSLQHPKTRGYHGERLFFSALRKQGILTPRYFWVRVVLNGDDIGLMALEEAFSKELLEHQSRKESVIVAFDEQLRHEATRTNTIAHISNAMAHRPIEAFGLKHPVPGRVPKTWGDYETAVGLLRGFVEGSLTAADVFDVDLVAQYIAHIELFALKHPTETHNMRFAFNPITAKLEPIAFDGNTHQPVWNKGPDVLSIQHAPHSLFVKFLLDPNGQAAFRRAFAALTDEASLQTLQARLDEQQPRELALLRREYPCLQSLDLTRRFARATRIRPRLLGAGPLLKGSPPDHEPAFAVALGAPPPQPFGHVLRSYSYRVEGQPVVELKNVTRHEVVVSALNAYGEQNERIPVTLSPPAPFRLPPAPGPMSPAPSQIVQLSIPEGPLDIHRLEAVATLSGAQHSYTVAVLPYAPALSASPLLPTPLDTFLEAHPACRLDASSLFLAGAISLPDLIVLPEGHHLDIAAGTVVTAGPDGGVIVPRGSLRIEGTAAQPVRMGPADDAATWRGLVTLRGDVDVKHLEVRRTRGMDLPRYKTTGGVLFHQGDVRVAHSTFVDHQGEDALNIVRSTFVLDNVTIRGALSDGFDADFCTGTINGGLWENIGKVGGGDGIDVSGSTLDIVGTRLVDIDDKALSAGEQSTMRIRDVSLEDVGAGGVAKDGSTLTGSGVALRGARAGFMAYIKKDEYGVARIELDKTTAEGVGELAVVQDGSTVRLNGQEQETTALDVEELYATVMKPGMRK